MKIITLIATEQEAPTLKYRDDVFIIGVGKVNATQATTQCILEFEPDMIINYGTAGAITPYLKGLVECTKFIQWDMNCSPLGIEKYHTPYEPKEYMAIGNDAGMVCGTGDSFVTDKSDMPFEVVDMEAYAIAKVCGNFGVPFRCFKFISDSANETAANDWQKFNFADAEEKFLNTLNKVIDGNRIKV